MAKPQIVLILDNIRSAHNVGAIWRTADAAGVDRLVLAGITPHPRVNNDHRLPHAITRAESLLAKTALGAESRLPFEYFATTIEAVGVYKQQGYRLAALEQSLGSTKIFDWQPATPLALVVGNEVDGVDTAAIKACDEVIEIPMFGHKESLNVAVATGVLLYFLQYKLQK